MNRLIALFAVALSAVLAPPAARADGQPAARDEDRVAAARERHAADIRRAFDRAGAAWPPRGLFLRAFKAEGVLELWASPAGGGRARVHVRDFQVCAASGELGPKRREGDLQVPEGFYSVDRYNRRSRFHLSLGLDYPNTVDRHRAAGAPPGGDIFIHGSCFTVGCLPLRDEPVAWLFVAALDAREAGQRALPVHVFPCRMDTPACQAKLIAAGARDPALMGFWDGLRPGYELFERTRVPPRVTARRDGTYAIAAGR